MSPIIKIVTSILPSGFLWRLTALNVLVIVAATAISGWAFYNTACFLAAGVGGLDEHRQQQFNSILLNYLWIFVFTAAFVGSLLHFYLIKRITKPIRSLIKSTEQLRLGNFPEPVKIYTDDEIGQLVTQYNGLIEQLKKNEIQQKKLVSDLSHEVRTPLSNLSGYLHALKEGDIIGNEKLFTALHQEAKRLSHMIEQLDQLKEWDYLSSQSLVKKDMYEIEHLLNQCVGMFELKRVEQDISFQLEAEPCKLLLHIEGMQQVISNLLDNAIRYYEGFGPIIVEGKNQENGYRISITGPSAPIPEMEKENVFKRFYRLDASRSRITGGSGLGLAISKEIVENHHHGQIGIVTSNHSNSFWIILPKANIECECI